jgi:hypothetical protein
MVLWCRHVQETVAPLFGSGALSLLDSTDPSSSSSQPFAPPQSKERTETASSYGSTGVTGGGNKNKGNSKRTTEQAANEIKALAQAYGKMQQQKQQAEENRRLFSSQQQPNEDNEDTDEPSSHQKKKKKKKKTNSKSLKEVDEFGTINSRNSNDEDVDEDDDDDDMNDEEKQALLLKEQLKPHMPKQNPCLWFFHLLAGFSVVVLLCLVATQIIPVVAVQRAAAAAAAAAHGKSTQWWQTIGIFSLALKVYISLFSLIFCLVEMQLRIPFIRSANVLQNFVSRGFIYSFVGLVATSEAYQEHVQQSVLGGSGGGNKQSSSSSSIFGVASDSLAREVPWEAIFMQVSAWVMLGIGFFYTLLGICCLQPLFERLREQERLDWQKYRTDYRAWKTVYGRQ